MQNIDFWTPTKYVLKKNRLKASWNKRHVARTSVLIANIVAARYSQIIPQYFHGKLLDLGCAGVPLYGYYKKYISEVVCVDWADSFHESSHLDIVQDLNQPLQLEDNQFDTVLLSDVLEHIKEPQLLLNEIFRVLKPEGKLVLNVPYMYWLHEEPYDFYRYTRFGLEYLLKKSGFSILELEEYGGAPVVLADVFTKSMKSVPIIGKPLAMFCQLSCLLFVKPRLYKKNTKKTSEKFPLGYMAVAVK